MMVLLFLCLSSMLLCGPTDAVSRHRRQQLVNISSSDGTETSLLDKAVVPPEDMTTLRPDMERACQNFPGLQCLHGIPRDCKSSFSCRCDSGWTGAFCEEACTLPCVHGRCVTSMSGMFCNCQLKYKGKLCDEFVQGPKESTGSWVLADIPKSNYVPPLPVNIEPPELNSRDNNDTGTTCSVDYCKQFDMCADDQICITSPPPSCQSRCVKNGSDVKDNTPTTEIVPPGDTATLRPDEERTCPNFPGLECLHGIPRDCNGSFSCQCDSGWSGGACDEACTVPCVHGMCVVTVEHGMICSCQTKYKGKLCDELVPDLKERSRILAAILSSALAVALILIIIIPIIMWRLRVILILKLIYIFKEYEDEDGKENDAYISMTSTPIAEEFVYGSLRPILEKHNFKLFLQARDAPAGEVMSETILSALEKSRRTIMIITPDYIKNEWNRFEYLIAQHETLKLRQRIIPIILEDVEKEDVNMDKSLKHILDSIKCLKYPKAKPKSIISSTESLQDIQSPDSSKSVDSRTNFFIRARSNSAVSVPKDEQKYERKEAKFWKRLVLTMPKKKTQEDKSCFSLSIFSKIANHELSTVNCENKPRNIECDKQAISDFDFKINFINDNNNDAVCTKSGNLSEAKNIMEETQIQNDRLISSIA